MKVTSLAHKALISLRRRWSDRAASKTSGILLAIYIDSPDEIELEPALQALNSSGVAFFRVVVVADFKTSVRYTTRKIKLKYRFLRSIEVLALPGKGRVAAFCELINRYPGFSIVYLESNVRYPAWHIAELCKSSRHYTTAITVARAQIIRIENYSLLATSLPDAHMRQLGLSRKLRSDLIPITQGGLYIPAGVASKLADSWHSVPQGYLDQLPFGLLLNAMCLLLNIPLIPLTGQETFSDLYDASDAAFASPDYLAGWREPYSNLLVDELGELPVDRIACYKSPQGNILLMSGQADLNGACISLFYLYMHLLDMGENAMLVLPCGGDLEKLLVRERLGYTVLDVPPYQWVSPLSYSQEEEEQRIKDWAPSLRLGIRRLEGFIEENGIDLVHENTSGSFMAARAALNTGKKLVWHIREFNKEDHNQRLWPSFHPYQTMSKADACICISKSIKDAYSGLLDPSARLELIYNGIDLRTFYNPEHAPFSGRHVIVACVGRFCPAKGQLEIARAMPALLQRYPDVELHFAGSESDEAYSRLVHDAVSELGISDHVVFHGVLVDMGDFWSMVDITVVPSKREAFGRCTVEAMMAGCLVIGSNAGGTAELIDDGVTGLLYDPDVRGSLEEALVSAVGCRDASTNIARAGQSFAIEHFTSERNAEQVFSLHQELLNAAVIKEER